MFRKEHHAIYLLLLTLVAVIGIYLVSTFFSAPLNAAREKEREGRGPITQIQPPAPPVQLPGAPKALQPQAQPKIIMPETPKGPMAIPRGQAPKQEGGPLDVPRGEHKNLGPKPEHQHEPPKIIEMPKDKSPHKGLPEIVNEPQTPKGLMDIPRGQSPKLEGVPLDVPRGEHKNLGPKPEHQHEPPKIIEMPKDKSPHKGLPEIVNEPPKGVTSGKGPQIIQVPQGHPEHHKQDHGKGPAPMPAVPPVVQPESPQAGPAAKEFRHHDKHHHKKGHHHRHPIGDVFAVYPYYYDFFDPPEVNVYQYYDYYGDDGAAYAEPEFYYDFDNRYSQAESSGQLYVDASEIASDSRLAMLAEIENLDLTVVNASNATFRRLLELTNLVSLKVSGKLVTEIPMGISELQNLTWLDLSGDNISVIPDEIGKMKALDHLILKGNPLKKLTREIGDLTNLEGLNLANTGLVTLPVEIARLRKLNLLDLSGNPTSMLDKPEIKKWVNHLITRNAKVKL